MTAWAKRNLRPEGTGVAATKADDLQQTRGIYYPKTEKAMIVQVQRVAFTRQQAWTDNLPTPPDQSTDTRLKTWEGHAYQLEAILLSVTDMWDDTILWTALTLINSKKVGSKKLSTLAMSQVLCRPPGGVA